MFSQLSAAEAHFTGEGWHRVRLGKISGDAISNPIVQAIALAEAGSTGEIRLQLSKRFIERNPVARATKLFRSLGMSRTAQHNAVLLYVNLRYRRFAIVEDQGISRALGQQYWTTLAKELAENLRTTHPERAIILAIESVGTQLQKHFPVHAAPQEASR